VVTETFAGLDKLAKKAGEGPKPKLAARLAILREIVAPISDDLPGLRDRALLLGFAGAFRRAVLARIAVGNLEACEHGLRITLPFSKGDRESKGVVVGIPYGSSALCPVRALERWRAAAGIMAGPVFCRIWTTPGPSSRPRTGRRPTSSASRRSIPARSPASSRRGAPPPGSTPRPSAAIASSAAR